MSAAIGRLRRPMFGLRDVGGFAVTFTVLLALAEVLLHRDQPNGGSEWARIGVLAMIVPVVFARRAPLAAAVTQASATLLNELAFGHLVRCGTCLPAAFYLAYTLGNRRSGRARSEGIAFVLAGVGLQCWYDPQLGASQVMLMWPVTLLFLGAGIVVASRSALLGQLLERNTELTAQREQTAQIAVAADRNRIRVELLEGLRGQIHEIAQVADVERTGRVRAAAGFATIERTARDALERMRDVVGSMQVAPIDPEPDLLALRDLLRSATIGKVRLVIEGDARVLPASIELSGYRIVERLLAVVQDDPAARAQVRVLFADDALELSVTGPLTRDVDPVASFTGVVDRAALHGGTLYLREAAGRLDATVRLPLVSSRA